MLLLNTLLSLIFFMLSVVDASPPIYQDSKESTLRFAATVNMGLADGRTLSQRDRARARALVKRGDTSISVTNALYSYSAQVGVGDPVHIYTLLVDVGSSNTWVGANQSRPYIHTKTSVSTGNAFSVSYSANVSGEEYLDTVTLSPCLVIENQSIGAATSTSGDFEGLDGILGIGLTDLTSGTVENTPLVPTVIDNLYSQGKISEKVFGVYFIPSSEPNSIGEVTFGGYDERVITSQVDYVPLTNAGGPASLNWGVNQSVSYGGQTVLSNGVGIIDTGTTSILLATEAFQKYQKLTGATMDNATGLLTLTADQYANLKPLSFCIGGASYELTPNAQIWPRSLNVAIGGSTSAIYLIVGDLRSQTDLAVDFINGYVFLQRFYTVYDTMHRRIGFARTAYTDSNIN